MNHVIDKLPVLIVNPHSRCNCRCVMCDIWKTDTIREISEEQFREQLKSIERLGVEWIVFSGGEPLMHSNLFALCALAKSRGVRVTVLSTGLLLERYAEQVAAHVDDLIVSLDGPAGVHNRIRRVEGTYERIVKGIAAVRTHRPDMAVAARCTVQKANHARLVDTVEAARVAGFTSISFLAADVTSEAFNRALPWDAERQSLVALDRDEVDVLRREVDRVIALADPMVVENAAKLYRIVDHFRAHLEQLQPVAPICNAPWTSAVVEADGSVRPCFFHKPIGTLAAGTSLIDVVNGPDAIAFRSTLDISSNSVCRRCVCSLNYRMCTDVRASSPTPPLATSESAVAARSFPLLP